MLDILLACTLSVTLPAPAEPPPDAMAARLEPVTRRLPAEAVAAAVAPDLGASLRTLRDATAWSRFRSGALGAWVEGRPPVQRLLGLTAMLESATGRELPELLEALAGRGLGLALVPGDEDPDLLAVAASTDPRLVQSVLNTVMVFVSDDWRPARGSRWVADVGDVVLERRDDLFLLATDRAWLPAPRPEASLADDPRLRDAVARARPEDDVVVWMDRALLTAGGDIPARAAHPAASLLAGPVQAALGRGPWSTAALDVSTDAIAIRALAPADAPALRSDFGPLFPPAAAPPVLPELGEAGLLTAVLRRDLGPWWTGRDRYLQPPGVALSVEADGNLSTIFRRDIGPEVLHWIEPELLVVGAVAEHDGPRPAPDLPAGALRLALRPGHPDDLPQAFVNAFFAVMVFVVFQDGDPTRPTMDLDVERLPGDARLYTARWWRAERSGDPRHVRYNVSPSLLLASEDVLWVSSSAGLLRRIASGTGEDAAGSPGPAGSPGAGAVPREVSGDDERSGDDPEETPATDTAGGDVVVIDLAHARPLLRANREVLLHQRLLREGGDTERAAAWVDRLEAAAALFDEAVVTTALDDGIFTLALRLACR